MFCYWNENHDPWIATHEKSHYSREVTPEAEKESGTLPSSETHIHQTWLRVNLLLSLDKYSPDAWTTLNYTHLLQKCDHFVTPAISTVTNLPLQSLPPSPPPSAVESYPPWRHFMTRRGHRRRLHLTTSCQRSRSGLLQTTRNATLLCHLVNYTQQSGK